MNTRKLLEETLRQIYPNKATHEIREMVLLLLEELTGLSRAEILAGKEIDFTPYLQQKLHNDIERLNRNEPVQYIIGKAWFYGREYRVTPDVLIPRPETEEVIDAASRLFSSSDPIQILDVGTGSGCIAITLKLKFPHSRVYAIDICNQALQIARDNAEKLTAEVHFMLLDFLTTDPDVPELDLLISNPPYITENEKHTLHANVVNYEPHHALFVPDNDPLIFYKALAEKGNRLLKKSGYVVAEINERLGKSTTDLFLSYGYDAALQKDLSGKDRIVVAKRS
ncbi:MAG: peptide chain release factor N(5)-glutamine methyltransferase [Cyclobacteriaceae bacterium]|nr:peptide chain release factor N(5)-glutamine methyltransferase [Cyclobacteriaceae bacterium]